MMHVSLAHYLVVAAALFALGIVTMLTRRNAIGVLLGVELVLNAATLNFVAFDHYADDARNAGHVFALFIIALGAAEAAVALAIVLRVYRTHRTVDLSELTELRR